MGNIKNRQQPSIPSVPASVPAEMRQFLNALRTSVQTLQGDGNTNANLDRAVTLRELQMNEVSINPKSVLSSLSNIGKGGGSTVSGDVDIFGITVQQPTKPTGARVDIALTTAIVSWDPPRYPGHSYTEIFRQKTNLNSNGEPVDPPQFNEATMIHGTSSSSVFVETIEPEAGYYYWIRHVNTKDVKSPLNATEGIFGKNDLKLDGGLIKPNSINGELIAPGAISTDQLAPASIDGSKIKAGTIEGGNIKAGAIATYHILANAIDGTKIRAGSIDSDKIAAGTISSNHIRSGVITGDHIAAGTITGGKIAANTIDGGKITAGTSIRAPVIEGGVINGISINGSYISGGEITGTTIRGSKLYGATGDFTGSIVVSNTFGPLLQSHNITVTVRRGDYVERHEYGNVCHRDSNNSHYTTCEDIWHDVTYWQYSGSSSMNIGPFSEETVLQCDYMNNITISPTPNTAVGSDTKVLASNVRYTVTATRSFESKSKKRDGEQFTYNIRIHRRYG